MKTRKEIFDSFAEEYDSFRPKYPLEFISCVAKRVGLCTRSKLLEIGCGSGQTTRAFGELDFKVLAIDPSEALISIAKKHFEDSPSVRYDCLSFEDYDSNGQRYDFVFAANSFHWIAPEISWKKTHHLLKPKGFFSALTIKREIGPGLRDELDALYDKFSSAFLQMNSLSPVPGPIKANLPFQKNYFSIEGEVSYKFDVEYDADSYCGLMRTMSDHRMLPHSIQTEFFRDLKGICERHGKFKVANTATAKIYKKK